jgi:hypothetical protein
VVVERSHIDKIIVKEAYVLLTQREEDEIEPSKTINIVVNKEAPLEVSIFT